MSDNLQHPLSEANLDALEILYNDIRRGRTGPATTQRYALEQVFRAAIAIANPLEDGAISINGKEYPIHPEVRRLVDSQMRSIWVLRDTLKRAEAPPPAAPVLESPTEADLEIEYITMLVKACKEMMRRLGNIENQHVRYWWQAYPAPTPTDPPKASGQPADPGDSLAAIINLLKPFGYFTHADECGARNNEIDGEEIDDNPMEFTKDCDCGMADAWAATEMARRMILASESPTPGGEQAPRECFVKFSAHGDVIGHSNSSDGLNPWWVRMREVLPEATRRGEGTKP